MLGAVIINRESTMSPALLLNGHEQRLPGDMLVRRLLPHAQRRSVGPFVFFDHFGPVTLPAEQDSDIAGHPHIGLATVTYLFEGRLLHRDSLGSVQIIRPGAINWMTAGRGIVHSERTPDEVRGQARRLHGLQLWVALPPELEQCAPDFQHVPAEDLPLLALDGGVAGQVTGRLMVGSAWGRTSPVRSASPTLYIDLRLPPGAQLQLPELAPELALYNVGEAEPAADAAPQAALQVDGQALPAGRLWVRQQPGQHLLQAGEHGARLVLLGGAALPQPVRMWWNFVASDRQRIAEAARRWADGGFEPIPGDAERIAGPSWTG